MRGWKAVIGMIGLGLLIGAGIGFLLGRYVWPVRYIDVAPAELHPDWQSEYVRMVAMAYARDRDLALARARLALLGDPIMVLQQLPERSPAPLSPAARTAIADLLRALGASSASESSGGPP
ncbi:hypothetical protein HRbin22_00983 [Candidatus Thermoflexus japonica]|uniref:Uncharacterized protein n=1 Tax=Candidatus Thermoflexus japonica TaxID=2035417 RepID=A0A2H5Y5S1_9CHLR|nr:hypothetical protein HRbin22_00983 [Candidatus Thermoflexus japonica]